MLKICEDHDIIFGREMEISQVIGYSHPPGACYAFEKYRSSRIRSLWGKKEIYYKRIFRAYTTNILKKTRTLVYDPLLKSFYPTVRESDIKNHLKPEEGMQRLFKKSQDELELIALEIYDTLREIGISSHSIGITGSILANIHNQKISDIDITVRGCKEIMALEGQNPLQPLKGKEMELWVRSNSERLSLPPDLVKQMYSPSRRGNFKGRHVSIIPILSQKEAGKYQIIEGEPLGIATLVIELDEPSCFSYIYPSFITFKVIRLIDGSNFIKNGMTGAIISYEGLYSNLLASSRKVLVTGKTYLDMKEKKLNIILGVREAKSYAKKIDSK